MDILMLNTSTRLVLITRHDRHKFFHDFLMSNKGMDGVHRIGNKNELLGFRLGVNENSRKRTFALVAGSKWDPQVLSVIYTRSGNCDLTNIEDVLTETSDEMITDPTHYQFYSVTNVLGNDNKPILRGAAKYLIGLLKRFLEDESGPKSSKKTISPFRTFKDFLVKKNIEVEVFRDLSREIQLTLVMEHFCERHPKNLAQRAHMPNGAVLREVYTNAASPGKPDGICMLAYDYTLDQERLEENANQYTEGYYPVDYEFGKYLPLGRSGILVPAHA